MIVPVTAVKSVEAVMAITSFLIIESRMLTPQIRSSNDIEAAEISSVKIVKIMRGSRGLSAY
jgi:hypothetical protein